MAKPTGIGLYEFLIESELQHYYNAIKNDLKVQSVLQLKYVTEEDMTLVGMSRPEIRRLKKYFQKHYPQTYLAKMKKKLLSKKEEPIVVTSLPSQSPNAPGRPVKSVAPGRHIIQAESIVIHKTLGSGEFGTVQQGVWTSDDGQRTQVAIKCLSQERMENNPVEFLKEAAIMHSVDHEHIVRLYGVVLDTSALMLVTELAPLRSLLECLKEPSMLPNLGVPTLYDFAVQICDGMQYLESKRLIHRDLAARNILVFSRNKVKISDFGLSRALGVGKDYYQTNFNVNLKLPIAWCAPECINFLRFTSSSDVWAYGVALWEMFSYGFQPWAALTGQQILEAIDEPNHQRLEKPECCPNEIYSQIMLKCWHHDPSSRPTFVQLSHLILEVKPEQVQAIKESESKNRRDFIAYESGDIITVLDRTPIQAAPDVILWKGVLKCGKSGYFNPADTITYLGSNLPTVKQTLGTFQRNDSRSSSLRKGKISTAMISGPQGDLKHTGHVGTDGQVFGDITFLGAKCWVPRQVVPPYIPEPNAGEVNGARRLPSTSSSLCQDMSSSDTAPLLDTISTASRDEGSKASTSGSRKMRPMLSLPGASAFGASPDHEYHEISDEENECMGAAGGGVSNPALSSRSQSPIDSPRFEKTFDLDLGGPSLVDEVFSALESDTPDHIDEAHNVKNELRELQRTKKRFVSVKSISSSDRRTLDHAIQMANDLASKSMLDLDRSGKGGMTNSSLDDISSPRTPNSPTHRKKFSFMLGSSKADRERRNYSQEAASIPDIQSTLTEEAKDAYNCLIEKPAMGSLGFLTPSFANKTMSFNFPEKCTSKKADFFEPEPKALNAPQSLTEIPAPTTSTSAKPVTSFNVTNFPGKFHCRSFSKNDADEIAPMFAPPEPADNPPLPPRTKSTESLDEEVDGNPLRLLRQNKLANVLPLPPKRSTFGGSTTMRHQRKHPLLIPNRVQLSTTLESTSPKSSSSAKEAPAPPPKPQRINSAPATAVSTSGMDNYQQPSKNSTTHQVQQRQASGAPLQNGALQRRRESLKKDSAKACDSVLLYENVLESEESESTLPKPVKTNGHTVVKERSPSIEKPTPAVLRSGSGASITSKLNQLQLGTATATPPAEPESTPTASRINGSLLHRRSSSSVSATSTLNSETQASAAVEAPKPFKISPGNSIKIKTLQRILGSTATDQDCEWALNATDSDSAHAVKLLRLKALLPESLMSSNDAGHIVSVLEMSHWDVARAASFLLEQGSLQNKPVAKPRLKIQSSYPDHRTSPPRSDPVTTNAATSDTANNNNDQLPATTNGNYVRPTQV